MWLKSEQLSDAAWKTNNQERERKMKDKFLPRNVIYLKDAPSGSFVRIVHHPGYDNLNISETVYSAPEPYYVHQRAGCAEGKPYSTVLISMDSESVHFVADKSGRVYVRCVVIPKEKLLNGLFNNYSYSHEELQYRIGYPERFLTSPEARRRSAEIEGNERW